MLAHYYVTNKTNLTGIYRTIKLAKENSGQTAFLHYHKHDVECTDECGEVE